MNLDIRGVEVVFLGRVRDVRARIPTGDRRTPRLTRGISAGPWRLLTGSVAVTGRCTFIATAGSSGGVSDSGTGVIPPGATLRAISVDIQARLGCIRLRRLRTPLRTSRLLRFLTAQVHLR
ncbi:hypothetical protein ACWDYH_30600 [Nocardia goodfellowii]